MIVDLFAGMGGWDVGARRLGLDPVGIELDDFACRTRSATGLRTIRADLTRPLFRKAKVSGLIASPPCTDWSVAGKRAQRKGATGHLVDVPLRWAMVYKPEWIVLEQVPTVLGVWESHGEKLRRLGYSV